MVVDAHVHVVDFVQDAVTGEDLIAGLDAAGAERAVVFGVPVKKKWAVSEPRRPSYYLDDNAPCRYHGLTDVTVADVVTSLPEHQRARLAPLVCGIDPTDLLAAEELEAAWRRHPSWRGVGELLLRHGELSNLTQEEQARPDHPAMDGVLDLARSLGVPVSIHSDVSTAGRPREREYLPELQRALARHPGTTVVWCHAGADRSLDTAGFADMVREVLGAHPRLHVDLSWVVYDLAVAPGGEVDPEWVRLVSDHPERFVLGSDSVARPGGIADALARYGPLLDALGPTERHLVAAGNAGRLWFGD